MAMVAALRGDAAALHGALSPTLLLLGGIADWKFVGFNFPPFSVFTVSFLKGDNSPPEKVIVLSQVPSPLSSSMQGGALPTPPLSRALFPLLCRLHFIISVYMLTTVRVNTCDVITCVSMERFLQSGLAEPFSGTCLITLL